MTSQITTQEAREVFQYVKRRARRDPAFREQLLESPRETLEAEFDIRLPDEFNIRFVENRGADLTVVLPDPSEPDNQLSEDELQNVSGGAMGDVSTLETLGRDQRLDERRAWTAQLAE
jgi:hypothetical protein